MNTETTQVTASRSAQKLPDSKYVEADIADESIREIVFVATGAVYTIMNPVKLIMRVGGKTHRVIDSQNVVHCYPAPESGLTVIRWTVKEGKDAVRF